jgi:hypothetical protein
LHGTCATSTNAGKENAPVRVAAGA